MTARLTIVDDDPAFTDFLQTLLKSRGYAVDVFHRGGELLEALRGGLAPHVILLDVTMPDLDGLETLRAIRSAHPTAQVIMLSGRQAPSGSGGSQNQARDWSVVRLAGSSLALGCVSLNRANILACNWPRISSPACFQGADSSAWSSVNHSPYMSPRHAAQPAMSMRLISRGISGSPTMRRLCTRLL